MILSTPCGSATALSFQKVPITLVPPVEEEASVTSSDRRVIMKNGILMLYWIFRWSWEPVHLISVFVNSSSIKRSRITMP